MKRAELLSPAGSYKAFTGAVAAGADAVYFGMTKYSARAHAQNFTEEEALRAIRHARLHDVKTYLTVNTLVREEELEEIIPYLSPFVKAGLSGVLVQDFGLLKEVGGAYPQLLLHASTQMAVTGYYAAKALKAAGVSRIVPARELSARELKALKEKAGIEVEAFVHGAMCYSYSGMCLFSGMIGGRSGNRGRCAQACRLPYGENRTPKEEGDYRLSMKDLNGLFDLPALIDARIDAFKIEGRMKHPAYAAGVTQIYRKYIDRYLADPAHYTVDEDDLRILQGLYLRTQTETGFLTRHNADTLVTMGLPGYTKTDEHLVREMEARFLTDIKRVPVTIFCELEAGKPARLSLTAKGQTVTVRGETVSPAQKKPLTEEVVRKQLQKLGDSDFTAETAEVHIADDAGGVFLPVAALNALRRDAVSALYQALVPEAA